MAAEPSTAGDATSDTILLQLVASPTTPALGSASSDGRNGGPPPYSPGLRGAPPAAAMNGSAGGGAPKAADGNDSDEEVLGRHKRAAVQRATPRSLQAQYGQYLQQSWLEIRRNKFQYCLGCSSVFLVVVVVAAALSILDYAGILFLILSEAQAGQVDLAMSPESGYFLPASINYTAVADILRVNGTADMQYHTPRMYIYGELYVAASCPAWATANGSMEWSYELGDQHPAPGLPCPLGWMCLNHNCDPSVGAELLLWDSAREARMALGRGWQLPPVPKGHCYVSANLARAARLAPGDTVIASV